MRASISVIAPSGIFTFERGLDKQGGKIRVFRLTGSNREPVKKPNQDVPIESSRIGEGFAVCAAESGICYLFGGMDEGYDGSYDPPLMTSRLLSFGREREGPNAGLSFRIMECVSQSPLYRYCHAMTAVGNDLLVVFGGAIKMNDSEGGHAHPTSDLLLLHVDGRGFGVADHFLNPHPRGRIRHTLTTLGDRVMLFGGESNDTILGDLWELDVGVRPLSPTWRLLADSGPAARSGHTAFVRDDCLWIAGGWDGSQFLGDVWKYDGKWSLVASFAAGQQPVCEILGPSGSELALGPPLAVLSARMDLLGRIRRAANTPAEGRSRAALEGLRDFFVRGPPVLGAGNNETAFVAKMEHKALPVRKFQLPVTPPPDASSSLPDMKLMDLLTSARQMDVITRVRGEHERARRRARELPRKIQSALDELAAVSADLRRRRAAAADRVYWLSSLIARIRAISAEADLIISLPRRTPPDIHRTRVDLEAELKKMRGAYEQSFQEVLPDRVRTAIGQGFQLAFAVKKFGRKGLVVDRLDGIVRDLVQSETDEAAPSKSKGK